MNDNEIIKGSISDLIFRIETLSSDRDTIKVCVRAAKELAQKDEEIRQWKLAAVSQKERIDRDAARIAELESQVRHLSDAIKVIR